ncbi:hypothetical protein EC988_002655 [Linderina pennispora]|nr:hypothetical protein EC988_002655 [Linderina pennispora]
MRNSLNPWHRKRSACMPGPLDEPYLSPSLDDVKVKFIGRESSACPRYSQSKNDELDEILAYLEYETSVPEDSIPYIDEEDEIYIAEQLSRRQSLVKRQLRRVSTIMSRQFATLSGRLNHHEDPRFIYV